MSVNWIGGILSVVVLGLILLTVFILQNSVHLLITGNRAEGIVVEMDLNTPLKALTVEFSNSTGERIRVSGRSYSESPSRLLGDVVTVAYSPSNPRNAQLLLWSEFPLGAAGVILGFAAIIVLMWIVGNIYLFRWNPGKLKTNGIQAVATVIEANQKAHILQYRIDKENPLPAAKSNDFIALEITRSDWKPSQTEAEIKKGDQFRVYLDPLKPGKNYYIDFSLKLGNDPLVYSLDEEDDSEENDAEVQVGKLKYSLSVRCV